MARTRRRARIVQALEQACLRTSTSDEDTTQEDTRPSRMAPGNEAIFIEIKKRMVESGEWDRCAFLVDDDEVPLTC